MSEESSYDASAITALEGLEAVRKRPSMYIGDTSLRGLHHLVWEVVDNSVDEALAGHADRIDVRIHKDGSVSVKDNGRGIPVDQHKTGMPAVEVILTKLHAGGKFDKGTYKVSGGLHGVGISVVNALAEWLEIEVFRGGKVHKMSFKKGKKASDLKVMGDTESPDQTGTVVKFAPDFDVMEVNEFSFDVIRKRLRETAYLMGTKGLTITVTDHRVDKSEEFCFPGGLRDFVKHLNRAKTAIHEDVIYISNTAPSQTDPDMVPYEVELALQYNDGYNENIYTFVNNINTIEGGTHMAGFRSALTRALNSFAKKANLLKAKENPPGGEDLREGLTTVLSVKVADPQFEGQTKSKLGNREVQGIVESVVGEGLRQHFEENPKSPKSIFIKAMEAVRAREAARKARELVRRKSALEGNALPAKLSDCHKGTPRDEAELFLVEGDSAGGTAKQGRSSFQAILPLRGKILNVEKAPVDSILNHEEIRTIVTALGTGFLTDEFEEAKLRYGKIIIMTDADVDGSHIRTLLLTLFYRKMPELVKRGYIYVAQPPLFLVRGKKGKKYRYALNEKERAEIVLEMGIGTTSLTLPTMDGGTTTFDGASLRNLLQIVGEVLIFERQLPTEMEMPFVEFLAQARVPDMDLPEYYMVRDGSGSFFDTEALLEAELETLRGEGTLLVYDGPDSSCTRGDADVEVYNLHVGTSISPGLQKLLKLGIPPESFLGPATFEIKTGDSTKECSNLRDAHDVVQNMCEDDLVIDRYKGLGEMNGSQLYESTMNPETRTLYRVTVDDENSTSEIFSVLMGPDVEPRREFIEKHALEATNLDV
jgi:DNA gyrase subunit B